MKESRIQEIFFVRLVVIIFAYLLLYSTLYWYLGARLSAIMLLVGGVVSSPLLILLEKKGHSNVARLGLVMAGLYYIYATPFGIRKPLNIEFYYLVAMILPQIMFDHKGKKYLYFCLVLSPVVWAVQQWVPMVQLSSYWIPTEFPIFPFQVLNFFGAALIIAIFLGQYSATTSKLNFHLNGINAKLEEAQRIAKIGSWTFDVASKKIVWTKQMYHLFPENEASGPPSYERHYGTIHPEDQAHWRQTVEKCLVDGKPYQMRFRSVMAADCHLWIEAVGFAVQDQRGQVNAIGGTCQDITARVQAEESVEQERAKSIQSSKLASLGEMSAGMAHEINNPLAIISGSAELLERVAHDPEKLKAKVAMIMKATARISKIVKGLQKFSRSSGREPFRSCSLRQIALEAQALTETEAKRHLTPVTVEAVVEGNINCDEIEIEQVLVNLINNAIDAVKGNSEKWVRIVICEIGDTVRLRISDSGQGISPTVAAKLFQPFYTTKPVGKGTGLGLSISKGILDDHQAGFRIVSEEPNTCFEIVFTKGALRMAA